ncbi:MAG: response regulator [Desulfobacterales bacterium]|nr:response regulator [Desulfobacterales bacterium]
MKRFADLKIRPKILTLLITTGLLPLLAASFYGSSLSARALMDKSFSQLTSVQTIRTGQLETDFQRRIKELKMLAANGQTRDFVHRLTAFSREADFSPDLDNYIEISKLYAPALERFILSYGCQDLKIFDAKEGKLLYSHEARAPLWQKIGQTHYAGTGMARAFETVRKTRRGTLVDFEPFAPAHNAETAFFAQPIIDTRGDIAAVAVVQIGPSFIDKIMESRKGMGETGESYILDWDPEAQKFELRSAMKTMGQGQFVIGHTIPQNLGYWLAAVEKGYVGGSGTYRDSSGKEILAAFNRLNIPGQDWYLISKIDRHEVEGPVRAIMWKTIFLSASLVLVIGVGCFFLARGLTRPIIEDVEFAKAIARGEYDRRLELDQRDELGQLARALNHMTQTLGEMDWLKRGKEGLDDVLRGDIDDKELGRRFIKYMARHIDAQMGALYLRRGKELQLTASYAFSDREGNFNTIALGEGLVGQAALENQSLCFYDVKDHAPDIHYGTGRRKARAYMAVPLSFEDKLMGVFLLGAMEEFSPIQRRFIEQNAPNAAILFNAAKSRKTIQRLLAQAREQHDELTQQNQVLEEQTLALRESESKLQRQQEELRVTNEELEEQTRALKQSEEELQEQQEELRVTNEELEARTQALEKQKSHIKGKNQELIQAQEGIQKKAEELEVASRYKSEFLANMSHELRTPLNAILILSQILSANKEGNLTEKQVESAAAVHSSGEDLLTLINEILDLSKVEAGKVELQVAPLNLADLTRDLERIFQDQVREKGLEFQIQVGETIPARLTTDGLRLQQILRNLITNAVKFTPQGKIRLAITRPSDADLQGSPLDPETSVALSVTDEGIGISPEHQTHIFEAFHQADGSTSRTYGGTGLGLSISRELAKLLGGFIRLESKEGKGSTFTVVIPQTLADQPPMAEAPPETPRLAPPLQGPPAGPRVEDDRKTLSQGEACLLIIEDDPHSARVMRDFARDRGFKCLIAGNGETGLELAQTHLPSAIILDIGLPGINGWTVLERLKTTPELRHIPVHFMSADDASLNAMRMGAVGFLTKPVTLKKVEDTFKRIEQIITRPVRKLLVVEDDQNQQKSICDLIGGGDVETLVVETGEQAFQALSDQHVDCMVLDLGLADMSGFDLLEKLRKSQIGATIPVIIYTGRDLTPGEDKTLRKYTESIIIKGVRSPERLLEEAALFLHRVENQLPRDREALVKMVQDKEAALHNRNILLVDDDMRNVFALSSVLEEKGVNVLIARDGAEGVEMVQKNQDIDLVLMDIMMPRMDGYEATATIRKTHRELPIIALTAKAMKGDRDKCMAAGASDYLAKPVDTAKLISMLRVWLSD